MCISMSVNIGSSKIPFSSADDLMYLFWGKLDLCANFPHRKFKPNLEKERTPSFLTLSKFVRPYNSEFLCRNSFFSSSVVLSPLGQPLDPCLILKNGLTYSLNSVVDLCSKCHTSTTFNI